MRLAVTIGLRHGTTTPVVLTGPDVPYQKQRDAFKVTRGSKENADFERITLYELDSGNGRSMRFKPVPSTVETQDDDTPKADGDNATDTKPKGDSKPKADKSKP